MGKKPLYRYKFYEVSGELEPETIEEYDEVIWFGKKELRYRLNGSLRSVKVSNLDKYTYEQVHSFNPDVEHAREIILAAVNAKYKVAMLEAQKYKDLANKIKHAEII